MDKFKENIKICRKKLKLTQVELAEKLNTSHATINRYEKGVNEPTFDTLIKLAKFFNVTTDYLLGFEPVKKNIPESEFTQEQQQVVELVKKLNSKELEKVYNYLLGLLDARN